MTELPISTPPIMHHDLSYIEGRKEDKPNSLRLGLASELRPSEEINGDSFVRVRVPLALARVTV
jgi:hypothetical protein